MQEGFDNIVYSKNVLEFVTVASEFCAFVEKADSYSRKDFLSKSPKVLSLLYLKGSLLPELDSVLEGGNEKFVSEQDWVYIDQKVSGLLKDQDVIFEVTVPVIQQSEENSSVTLAEVFADIYQDLKDMISLYRMGNIEIMNDALWECKMNFEQYWGPRLLAAVSIMHNIIYSDIDLDSNK